MISSFIVVSGGLLHNFVNRQIIMIFVLAGASAVVHYVTSITTFLILGGIVGFAVGGMDTAQAAWVIDKWSHAMRLVRTCWLKILRILWAPLYHQCF